MPVVAKPISKAVLDHAKTSLSACFYIGVDATECLPFPRVPGKNGYPYFTYKGERHSATRVALLLAGKDLSCDQMAMHSCDNPPCVNPKHLSAGSAKDNMADAQRKGRMYRLPPPARRRSEKCVKCGHFRIDDIPATKHSPARCRKCRNARAKIWMAQKRKASSLREGIA